MSLDTALPFCYKARVNFRTNENLRGKLISHALFVDFVPLTPLDQIKRKLAVVAVPLRKGMENFLLELMFLIPLLLRAFRRHVVPMVARMPRWFREHARLGGWILLLGFVSAWLLS